jgi:eukaryotic-like serine/threonine-protein kinase
MGEAIRQLGRYELVRRIAVGGMGEIYLARMRGAAGFEKRVIIKTILPHLAEEEEFVEKFLDEGRIVVQLTHGNIVPVFDMGQQDGEYFIAMEYLPGRDLREIIKRLQVDRARMPVGLAVLVVMEVCKGLAYAHRKLDQQGAPLGLVHRDVSPSNILVSREGDVRIIDFGIARATGRSQRTASGRIQGRPAASRWTRAATSSRPASCSTSC